MPEVVTSATTVITLSSDPVSITVFSAVKVMLTLIEGVEEVEDDEEEEEVTEEEEWVELEEELDEELEELLLLQLAKVTPKSAGINN